MLNDKCISTLAAAIYCLAKHPSTQRTLQAELDQSFANEDSPIPPYATLRTLPYLSSVLSETLRYFSVIANGLPRVVPEGGLRFKDWAFDQGTVVGVPIYSVHRDKGIWGDDEGVWKPERWLEGDEKMKKSLIPFGIGARCVAGFGRSKI